MKATLKNQDGRSWLEVEYDPFLLNWDEAIRAGLVCYGLRLGQVTVIASPAAGENKKIIKYVHRPLPREGFHPPPALDKGTDRAKADSENIENPQRSLKDVENTRKT